MKKCVVYSSWFIAFWIIIFLFLPTITNPVLTTIYAHEAYVLPKAEFERGLVTPGVNLLNTLANPINLSIFIRVSLGILGLIILNLLFNLSKLGQKTNYFFYQFERYGSLITRLTLSTSLFFSALGMDFLGPELPLQGLHFAPIIQLALFVCSGLFLVGMLTEAAGVVSLVIYFYLLLKFGTYLFTYLNYLGEFLVLVLFGSRFFSVDQKTFGLLKRLKKLKQYETTIVRIFYGGALIFAAVTIKILHPQLSIEVVNMYNLTQFSWLFPHDPWLVALGAGLAEITIGVFIVLGFQLRLTILISLFYITLSLIYFQEAVWPHLLLYGISLNLLISKQKLSLDEYLLSKKHWFKERLVFL